MLLYEKYFKFIGSVTKNALWVLFKDRIVNCLFMFSITLIPGHSPGEYHSKHESRQDWLFLSLVTARVSTAGITPWRWTRPWWPWRLAGRPGGSWCCCLVGRTARGTRCRRRRRCGHCRRGGAACRTLNLKGSFPSRRQRNSSPHRPHLLS